ncbi:hypothetical protein ALNOE001_20170 [Candidatus Methanobinarius endosymbioticus]|uniref:Uncharacterized protein n=1 Tax=Candidatus Methanobinarius endosymbioticus TaxID=2006182 RepID=A0A366M8C4_9EURY|nr:hypothetical protein ALNOE001_20170 [Candidatus Methanobinarius endosymbioticus]
MEDSPNGNKEIITIENGKGSHDISSNIDFILIDDLRTDGDKENVLAKIIVYSNGISIYESKGEFYSWSDYSFISLYNLILDKNNGKN